MKRFAMIVLAVATMLGGIGIASAQGHTGGHMGGGAGGWHGGSAGAWHGGGGSWHGGSWHHDGHGHVVVGVGFGWPWWGWGWGWWPGYYYPYYYPYSYGGYSSYYDYPYYDSGGYVEQGSGGYGQGYGQPAPAPSRPEYSYYCPDPAGYYPQVATCPKGWLRVLPQNAPGPMSPVQH